MSKKQVTMTGGASSACALPTADLSKYMYRSCLDSNLHNKDPQANLEMAQGTGFLPGYGGAVTGEANKMNAIRQYNKNKMYAQMPSKVKKTHKAKKHSKRTPSGQAHEEPMTGGGCPTSVQPLSTFREYLERAAKDIGAAETNKTPMNGGGFVVDPYDAINGMPRILKYDDCCPPAMLGTSIVMDPMGSTCGSLAQVGGAASDVPVASMEYSGHANKMSAEYSGHANKMSAHSNTVSKMHTKSAKLSKRNNKHGKRRHTKKQPKKRTALRGGNPANYPECMNGEPGDFRYVGEDLTYGGRQPFWKPSDR